MFFFEQAFQWSDLHTGARAAEAPSLDGVFASLQIPQVSQNKAPQPTPMAEMLCKSARFEGSSWSLRGNYSCPVKYHNTAEEQFTARGPLSYPLKPQYLTPVKIDAQPLNSYKSRAVIKKKIAS